MKQYYQSRLATYSLWIDLILLNLAFGVSYWSYFQLLEIKDSYLILQLLLNLSWVSLTYFLQTYTLSRIELTANELFRRFTKSLLLQVLVITGILYFSKYGESVSRLMLGGTMAGLAVSGFTVRLLVVQWVRGYRKAGYNGSGFLTVGDSEQLEILQHRYSQRRDLGLDYRGGFGFGGRSLAEELLRLEGLMEETKPEYIYCCMASLKPVQVKGIIRLAERHKAQVRLVPDFRGFMSHQATLQYHDLVPVIEVSTKPFSNVQDETYKRIFDVVFSLLVIGLGAPVFGALMLLVKVFSPGPVFFRQQRTGRWGQTFMIYKFRSMYTDADRLGMQHSQGEHDPRVTPIGRVLRKTRLDELPQFINVLKGEMSVVGPRPLYRYDVDMLMEAAPEHFKRLLTVKPGITSIGQLKVGYADTLHLNLTRMRHDLLYLRKYSVWYDLYLIVMTMQVMIAGRGK